MIREEDKPAWRNFWLKVVPFLVAVLFFSFAKLGWQMSKQGIRSLIYCLLICGVIWTALIIKILHVTGVFNG
ncbi:TPA: hypothetical protein MIO02_21550 [Klebsiella pneumoniae]|nr:hypothetical protein [Klebsiella pneumoniae]